MAAQPKQIDEDESPRGSEKEHCCPAERLLGNEMLVQEKKGMENKAESGRKDRLVDDGVGNGPPLAESD